MKENIEELNKKFNEIKRKGWVKSICDGNNGVGLTFEALLGISRNELEIPDYKGIELKTKRYRSNSYITLFSCRPEGKYYHKVERIKDKYGYPHRVLKQYKVLNNSVYGNIKNKIGNKFYFKLEVNRNLQKIFLLVYDLNYKLLEKEVYWDFDILKEKLDRKLSVLAFVKASSKKSISDGIEYFKYDSMKIYSLKDFEAFINLLENGVIRLNFKLNIKTKGDKIGQIHDHGTSFDILEKYICLLYDEYKIN